MDTDSNAAGKLNRWRRLLLVGFAGGLGGAVLLALPELVKAFPIEIRWWLRTWGLVALLFAAAGTIAFDPLRLFVVAGVRSCCVRLLDRAVLACRRPRMAALADSSSRRARTLAEVLRRGALSRLNAVAEWALQGRLTVALVVACLLMLVCWVPHYLTWPWWIDIDQFAVSAQAWDAGILPYRDLPDFDFPGPIYMLWILGKTFGWGRTFSLYALDACLVVLLGVALLTWSRHRFGQALPGLASYLIFLGYYLNLDYAMVAQRDWRAPLFAVLGLLVLETWPGRSARLASALTMAVAFTFRPHVVLFLPALASAIGEGARTPEQPWTKTLWALAEWSAAFAVFLALAFAPILLAGVATNFLSVLHIAQYGGSYNRVTLLTFFNGLRDQLTARHTDWLLAASVLMALVTRVELRRSARTWALALIGVVFYKPLSPIPHNYLNHPMLLIWSIALALLVQWLLATRQLAPFLRLLVIVVLLQQSVPGIPRYCSAVRSIEALEPLARGEDPIDAPMGCEHLIASRDEVVAHYRWQDYRAVLAYLRRETRPETRVANLLRALPYPSINGPAGRITAFPAAGGLLYLSLVDPAFEGRFAQALEESPDTVVVWIPDEACVDTKFKFDCLTRVIRLHYQPETRFGIIEIWVRKRTNSAPSMANSEETPDSNQLLAEGK